MFKSLIFMVKNVSILFKYMFLNHGSSTVDTFQFDAHQDSLAGHVHIISTIIIGGNPTYS